MDEPVLALVLIPVSLRIVCISLPQGGVVMRLID